MAVEKPTWGFKSELSISRREFSWEFNPVVLGEASGDMFYNGGHLGAEDPKGMFRGELYSKQDTLRWRAGG